MVNYKKLVRFLEKKHIVVSFSLLFIVLAVLIYSPFWTSGKSFIWEVDGSKQHYPALVYIGTWLREVIRGLFSGKGLHARLWDMSLGYGSDILTTLNYYSFGDPLDLLSVLVPKNKTEYLYSFLCVFRLYLSGLAFLYFCDRNGHDRIPSLIGALVYCFSGFALLFAVRHPFFINAMIYLPMLLVGTERLVKEKKTILFHLMVMISFISNFYFFYMLMILAVIYAVLVYIDENGFRHPKLFFAAVGRGIWTALLGIANAAVIMLPVLIAALNTERASGGAVGNLLHYSLNYYVHLPSGFLYPQENTTSTTIGLFGLSVVALVLGVRKRAGDSFIRRCYSIGVLVAIVIPVFGYGLNGLMYVCNRWTFFMAFAAAWQIAGAWDRLWELEKRDWCIVGIVVGTIAVSMLFPQVRNEYSVIAFMIFLLEILVLYMGNFRWKQNRELVVAVVFVCLFVDIFSKAYYRFSVTESGVVNAYYDAGTAYTRLRDDAVQKVLKPHDSGTDYRVDSLDRESRNYGVLEQMPTVSTYFSVTPSHYTLFSRIMGNAAEECTVSIASLDGRAGLQALFGVKYVTSSSDQLFPKLPYGYKRKLKREQEKYNGLPVIRKLHKSTLGVSMLYSVGHVIPYSEFLKLSTEKREEIMLRNLVVNDDCRWAKRYDSSKVYSGQTLLSAEDIRSQLKKMEGVHIEGDRIVIERNNFEAKLKIKGMERAETRLYVDNMQFQYTDSYHQYLDSTPDPVHIEKKKARLRTMSEEYPFYTRLYATCNNRMSFLENKTPVSTTRGIDTAVINMGYNQKAPESIKIKFQWAGVYSFDDIRVVGESMDAYREAIQSMNSAKRRKLTIKGNAINADIHLDQDAPICIAVPYSSGWSAVVNGKKTEIEQGNIMFMAVEGHAGDNHIEMRYRTPGLKEGAWISGLSLLLAAVYYMIIRKRR